MFSAISLAMNRPNIWAKKVKSFGNLVQLSNINA